TPGFTYHQSYEANTVVFDPNVSGTAAPTATQSPAGTSAAVGALIKVSATSRLTPTVTSLSPVQGPSAGGTLVTVTGTNFAAGDTVDFGAVAASTVTVSSPTSLVATSPAGTGTVDVTVTSAGGTSAATAADHFAYQGSTTPTISAVGSLADADAAGVSSLSVQPVTGGDALVLSVKITSATASVASVTGGGVTSWTKLVSFHDNSGRDIELWLGTVTATGTSSIRVGYSASVGSSDVELVAQEFTAGLGSATLWAKDAAAGQNNASSTSIAYPSLTASGPGELYVGYARSPNSESAGSTPGFTYHQSYEANTVVFDPNVSGTAAPTATQSPAGTSAAVGALIKVSATSRPTPTVTSLSPVQGPSAGGTLVTVTGTNFAAGDTVDFGAVAAS